MNVQRRMIDSLAGGSKRNNQQKTTHISRLYKSIRDLNEKQPRFRQICIFFKKSKRRLQSPLIRFKVQILRQKKPSQKYLPPFLRKRSKSDLEGSIFEILNFWKKYILRICQGSHVPNFESLGIPKSKCQAITDRLVQHRIIPQ